MNTPTNASLADLLQHLFAEAEANVPSDNPALADLLEAELKRLMSSKTGYREPYGRLRDLVLPVSRETGNLLCILARSSSTRGIVEFGISLDLFALHLAAALQDSGGGCLVSSEFEPSKAERAWCNPAAGRLLDLVGLHEGDALQTLAKDPPDSIDLVLLDGAKVLYPKVLALLENRLHSSALVITDSAEHSSKYLTHIRSPTNGHLSTPFVKDVELSIRLG